MAHGSTIYHYNYLIDVGVIGSASRPTTFDVALYDDEADDLDDEATFADAESEPTDGNYARETIDMDQVTREFNGAYVTASAPDAEFDLTDTTGEVDSMAIAWSYDGDDTIMTRQELDGRYDLADWSGVTTVGVEWQFASIY